MRMRDTDPGVALVTGEPEATDVPAESSLVALAAGGDTRAFERLYRQHVARVHSLACRMAGRDHAEELTQEVFIRAWEKLWTFRGEASFGTWLSRVAVRWILTWRAGEAVSRRRRENPDILAWLPARPARPDLAMDFEAALERLPEGARQIFVLHDVEGYKHEEIGRLLEVSAGTSKAQLHRARMLLRRHLER
jgi:RNA polymerase sigma-70 factor (ECF subfamily)